MLYPALCNVVNKTLLRLFKTKSSKHLFNDNDSVVNYMCFLYAHNVGEYLSEPLKQSLIK